MSYSYKSIAPNGWRNISDTTLHQHSTNEAIDGYGIVVLEDDTIITVFTDSDGNNLIPIFNISGVELKISDPPIIIPNDKRVRTLQLSAGRVGILK
jgi:hypothetical protein